MNTDSGRKSRKIIGICAAIALAALLAVCCILATAYRGGVPAESPEFIENPSFAESSAPSESPEPAESSEPESDGINHLPFAFVDATEGNMLTELALPLEITGDTEFVALELCGYEWWGRPYLEIRISNLQPDKPLEVLPGAIEYLTDDGWVEVDYSRLYHRFITASGFNGQQSDARRPDVDARTGRAWADISVDSGKSYKDVLDVPFTIPGTYRVTWTYWNGFRYSDPPHDWHSFSTVIEVPDIPEEYADSQCLIFGNIEQKIYGSYNNTEVIEDIAYFTGSRVRLELLFPDGSTGYELINDSFRIEEIYPNGKSRRVSTESGEVGISPGRLLGTSPLVLGPDDQESEIISLVPEESYVPYIYEFVITFDERQEDGRTYFCTVDFTDDPVNLTPAFTVSFKFEF